MPMPTVPQALLTGIVGDGEDVGDVGELPLPQAAHATAKDRVTAAARV